MAPGWATNPACRGGHRTQARLPGYRTLAASRQFHSQSAVLEGLFTIIERLLPVVKFRDVENLNMLALAS